MNDADEARYGRVCFLVLNVCPFTLRHVINDYYIRHGSLSLQDFLEKHKHDLYHLWKKKCCCRSRQSKDTVINRSQWDRLYIRNTSTCGTGHGGDCPCQYDARPGVTTDIMDVTLCCLVITRLCPGINMSHIDTIREVRNNVIHAERASLDQSTFYSYWNKVQTAIIDLANHVSHSLRADTFKMVKDLEGRVMNYEELKEMRNFIVEQERMKETLSELDEKLPKLEEDSEETHLKLTDLQGSVDQTAENVIQIQDSVNQTTETVTQVEDNLNQTTEKIEHMEDNLNQTTEKVDHMEDNLNQTTEKVDHMEDNLNQTTEKVEHMEDNLNQTTEKIDHMEDNLNQTTEKVEHMEDNLNQTTEKVDHMEDNLNQTTEKVDHMEDNLNQTTEKVEHMEDNLNQTTEKVEHIEDNINQTTEKVEHIEDNLKQTTEKVDHMEDNINQTTEKVEHIEDNLKQTTEKVEHIEDNLNQTTEKVDHMEDNLNQTTEKVEHMADNLNQTTEKVEHIEDNLNQTTEKVDHMEDNINQTTEKVEHIEDNLKQTTEKVEHMEDNVEKLLQCKETDVKESDVQRLNQRLLDINENTTQEVPLSPVQVDGDTFPIEQLFCSVVIKEDCQEITRRKRTEKDKNQQEQKEVRTAEDLLTKDGKPVSNIFMIGDAAHGKTTYCLWLLRMWCNSKQRADSSKPLNEWEKALGQFDFVFHLPLRHVDRSRADVIDMICHDLLGRDTVLQAAAKHVLHDDKYRCFFIMDGLDEWKPNQTVLDQLKYRGFPNIDNMSNCVIFTTMRSWVFSEMAAVVRRDDRVIEIKGLDYKGIRNVIEKVLEHHYEMKPSSEEYKLMLKDMTSKLGNETLKSFIKIPLLAVVCVQIWYSGGQVGDSLTSFYIALINMLIQRAHLKHKTQNEMFEATLHNLPTLLSAKENIKKYFGALFKLGEVAYRGLLTGQMKLVFPRVDLEANLGKGELRFALDVGLISQRGTHGIMEEMVSVNFFHKSIQEFLAAVYAVTNWNKIDPFCKQLTNVNVIMKLSNVIMFICGMCPSLGSEISQRVVSVTDCDTEICEYRGEVNPVRNIKVIELYKQQASWYREFTNGHTHSPSTFHVSDVSIDNFDRETMRITRKLFLDPSVTMRSLKLFQNYTDEVKGLPDTQGNFLANEDNTMSLVMLNISCPETDVRSVYKICGSSLGIIYLQSVRIHQPDPDTAIYPPLISNLSQLRVLKLWEVTLGDRLLGLTPEMVYLEKIDFYEVRMSPKCWRMFISSVIEIEHKFEVRIIFGDIDSETIEMIEPSPHFSSSPYWTTNGTLYLSFIREWPPKKLINEFDVTLFGVEDH